MRPKGHTSHIERQNSRTQRDGHTQSHTERQTGGGWLDSLTNKGQRAGAVVPDKMVMHSQYMLEALCHQPEGVV